MDISLLNELKRNKINHLFVNDKKEILIQRKKEDHTKLNRWEIPSGHVRSNEPYEEAAKRELFEETGQSVTDLEFIGLAKVKNIMNGMEKFNPVFYSSIHYLQPFIENQETDGIRLWDVSEPVNIDQVDLAILEYVKNMNLSRSGS